MYGYWITVNYREAYNMYACNGILFNHVAVAWRNFFVSRKVTRAVARMVLGLQTKVYMGNLDSNAIGGHARDYIEAMYLILQQKSPDDYVIATGEKTSVREFMVRAFSRVGYTLVFKGSGVKEVGIIVSVEDVVEGGSALKAGDEVVCIDPRYFRPTEVDFTAG
jgi:GDPmannose 4,6-dehydratase